MKTQSDEILITLADLKKVFLKRWPQIKKAAWIGAFLSCAYLLMREPRFSAEATFNQASGSHQPGLQLKEIFQSFTGRSQPEPGTLAFMHSRTVLRDVVEELGLQIQWDRHFRITQLLGSIWENIGLQLGIKLAEADRFVFQKVKYDGELEKILYIQVLNNRCFVLLDDQHQELGKWELNEPIHLPQFSACLTKFPSVASTKKLYRLRVLPWINVVNQVRKHFAVRPSKIDRTVFTLTFTDRNRHLTADFVNQAMKSFQKAIRIQNDEVATAQLDYLEVRQEELSKKWDAALQEHVAYLKNNLNESGYLSFAQELERLEEPQLSYANRLLDLDFELEKLEAQDFEDSEKTQKNYRDPILQPQRPFLHVATTKNGTAVILDQQKQEIEQKLIHLQEEAAKLSPLPEQQLSQEAQLQMAEEIQILSQQQAEASKVLEHLEKGGEFSEEWIFHHDPKSLVGIWAKQIAAQQKIFARLPQDKKLYFPQEKNQLKSFIEQTASKIKILQDNIHVHQSKSEEFVGLTLDVAQRLYLDYNSQRDSLQAQLKQMVYLSEQLYQPQFELSCITTILSDPVTHGLVVQAGETTVKLQDGNNRSPRELDHLRETLDTQKSFISQHLLQTIELTKLRVKLTEDKIASLRKTTIDLLRKEKEHLQHQLDQINQKMASLPEKWRRENLLLMKKEIGMKMVEGLSHFMESKSIERHLFQAASRPLDKAFIPVTPQKTNLPLNMLICSILAAFLTYLYFLTRSLVAGLPLSHDSLALLGLNSCGKLSRFCHAPLDQISYFDLETLRRLVQFLLKQKQKGICCAIIAGKQPDFSSTLAQLLHLQQKKVLIIHYVFDEIIHPHQIPGLWQYLHDELSACPIRTDQPWHELPSGGTSRHGVEMLSHPKLHALLAHAKETYDVILLRSTAKASDMEGQALLNIADAVIVALSGEKKEDLVPFEAWEQQQQKECVAFLDIH